MTGWPKIASKLVKSCSSAPTAVHQFCCTRHRSWAQLLGRFLSWVSPRWQIEAADVFHSFSLDAFPCPLFVLSMEIPHRTAIKSTKCNYKVRFTPKHGCKNQATNDAGAVAAWDVVFACYIQTINIYRLKPSIICTSLYAFVPAT